ncbi:hypothetical protein [Microscilla marina]|uniref:PsbP C-terminal domain-containing protein n=1 Tax=Microscilla marina ATCC 23134 TaxID=313606 RepID=A1ZUF8_MICM2|nr:hypothetical protein [Microscilla marina]EAY25977.1 hypothetical protein M23134_07126 [Microscilla marina ATCC 23134]
MLQTKSIGALVVMLSFPFLLTAQTNTGQVTNYDYPWKKHKLLVRFNPDWKVSKITDEKMLANSEGLQLEVVPWKNGGASTQLITKQALVAMKDLGKNIVLNEQDRGIKRGFAQYLVFTQFKGKETQYFVIVALKDDRGSTRLLAKFHWKGNKGISAKMKKIYTIVDSFEKITSK